jgi:hypothetical protein
MQLLQNQAASTQNNGVTGSSGDLLTLSNAAQQLNQAPAAVTQALQDLLSGQTDITGDVEKVKSYFKANPQSLATVMNSLKGSATATYSATNSTAVTTASLAALMQGQQHNPNTSALLSLLSSTQSTDPLYGSTDSSGSSNAALTLFG